MPNSIENQPYIPTTPPPVAAGEAFSWWSLIGTTIVFLLVLLVVLWLVKEFNRRSLSQRSSSWVRIIDRQALSNRQYLYLVDIAGKFQVLGGSDQHLTKIEEITDPQMIIEILREIDSREPKESFSFFKEIWQKINQRKNKNFSQELEELLREDKD